MVCRRPSPRVGASGSTMARDSPPLLVKPDARISRIRLTFEIVPSPPAGRRRKSFQSAFDPQASARQAHALTAPRLVIPAESLSRSLGRVCGRPLADARREGTEASLDGAHVNAMADALWPICMREARRRLFYRRSLAKVTEGGRTDERWLGQAQGVFHDTIRKAEHVAGSQFCQKFRHKTVFPQFQGRELGKGGELSVPRFVRSDLATARISAICCEKKNSYETQLIWRAQLDLA